MATLNRQVMATLKMSIILYTTALNDYYLAMQVKISFETFSQITDHYLANNNNNNDDNEMKLKPKEFFFRKMSEPSIYLSNVGN